MKKIAFFNNKGGVGKTTLVCNVAHYLATEKNLRVLIMDLDPQCNATQLVLPMEDSLSLYWPADTTSLSASTARDAHYDTIYDVAKPIEEGDSSPKSPNPIPASANRFEVALVPGHPRMSFFEDRLGPWFKDARGGGIEGLRRTLWLEEVLADYESDYDVVLFDVGPSLGALNRSVLAASDHFVTPMGADIFSVVALKNIAEWISEWVRAFEVGVEICSSPSSIVQHNIPSSLPIKTGFAGYTVQQYSTVSVRGERRATVAYEQIISQIPDQIHKYMLPLAYGKLEEDALSLGDVPNLRSLVPLGQSANAPLSALMSRDGLAGGQYTQQKNYAELIAAVGDQLTENCIA